MRIVMVAIALLAIAGVAVSSVSLYHHYGTSATSFCTFGAEFNCDVVNRSVYSTIAGVPVALIGILGYAALFGLAIVGRKCDGTRWWLLAASVLGLGFALYLTYIEKYVLTFWCILCLSSLALIATITFLSGILVAASARKA